MMQENSLQYAIKEGAKWFSTGTSSMFHKLRHNMCTYHMYNINYGNLSIKGLMYLRLKYITIVTFVYSECSL